MSDFLNILNDAHAFIDEKDPAVLIIPGKTPDAGVTCTSWPVDGTVADAQGLTFRPVATRVSVIRNKITGLPEPGDPAVLDGKSYTIGTVKTDSVSYEMDMMDPRQL